MSLSGEITGSTGLFSFLTRRMISVSLRLPTLNYIVKLLSRVQSKVTDWLSSKVLLTKKFSDI
jgi:hypothetical protein